jgi:hypothetical protein
VESGTSAAMKSPATSVKSTPSAVATTSTLRESRLRRAEK